MFLLLLLQWLFLEMILSLFLPRLPQGMDLLILMDISISICPHTWHRLFRIYLLNLLLEVEADLFILMNVNIRICLHTWLMPFEICHLNHLLEVEVEVEVMDLFILMNINIKICLHTWLMPFEICHWNLQLEVEVEVEVEVVVMATLNSITFLKTLLRILQIYHPCNLYKDRVLCQFQ
jgi:hypothetical protein